ncbi:MAG: T9SS type A sorting domain-containing protein [Candidatus Paceibacterota bacterium]
MKTKFLWCLVLLMTLNTVAIAQIHPMDVKNDKSIWNRIKDPLSNEVFYKGKQNSAKLNSTTSSYWNGVEMELSGKTEYSYNNDQLVSVEYFYMEESEWIENAKMEYAFNDGLLSSVTFLDYDFDSGAYVPVHQYNYAYQTINNEPLILTELYREWEEGSGWISVEKFEYEYENGLISGGSENIWETTEWVEVERFTTTTDNDTTYITYFEFDSENWVEYSREIYPTLTLSELYDLYLEIIIEIEYGITYLNLEFPDYIYQERIDDTWQNVEGQHTADYYDLFEGKLKMREIQHRYWDEDWAVVYNNEIWYNQKVNPDSATTYVFLGDGKEAAGQEVYTYNNASQLSEVDYLQNIGNGLTLQSITVLNWEVGTSNEPKLDISSFKLNPAYPNPFNPTTNITYSMEQASAVKVNVYDMLGRYVATLVNGVQPAGEHQVQFNASGLSSGLYFVRMEASGFLKTQKITLLK